MELWEWGMILANMALLTANIAMLRKRIKKKSRRRRQIQQYAQPYGLEQMMGGR